MRGTSGRPSIAANRDARSGTRCGRRSDGTYVIQVGIGDGAHSATISTIGLDQPIVEVTSPLSRRRRASPTGVVPQAQRTPLLEAELIGQLGCAVRLRGSITT